MSNIFQYSSSHRLSRFLAIFIAACFIGLTGLVILQPGDQILEKRKEAMKDCVEIKIFPHPGNTEYEIRFEDRFFCPTQPYTALEVLTRTESVLNTRNKPIRLVLRQTSTGIVIESLLDKINGDSGIWEIEINGNKRATQPLDKIFLEGRSFINFYYRQ